MPIENHIEAKLTEHEGRLSSIETVLASTTETLRDLSSVLRDREQHLDTQMKGLREHVDIKIDNLGDKLSKSREARPALMVGIVAIIATVAGLASSLIVLAISNAVGPLQQMTLAMAEDAHEQKDMAIRHMDLDAHPGADTRIEQNTQGIALLRQEARAINEKGGGRWTQDDERYATEEHQRQHDKAEQHIVTMMKELRQRVRALETTGSYQQ